MIELCGREMLADILFFTVVGRLGTLVRVMTKTTRSFIVTCSITLRSITCIITKLST
jgi:hypothetical protein